MSDLHPIVSGLLADDFDEAAILPILEEEADAKPHVLQLLRDRNLWWPDSPGGGRAPVRALFLVGKLGWDDAIPDVLDALMDTDPDDLVYPAAIEALTDLGPDAAIPVLTAARSSSSPRFRKACAEVLANLGVRDPAVLAFLHRLLDDDPELAAGFLVDYGDPESLTALHRALQEAPDPVTVPAATAVRELAWAIQELGGSLTPGEEAKAFRAQAWLGARRKRLER